MWIGKKPGERLLDEKVDVVEIVDIVVVTVALREATGPYFDRICCAFPGRSFRLLLVQLQDPYQAPASTVREAYHSCLEKQYFGPQIDVGMADLIDSVEYKMYAMI